ncbi:hypothetical protein [Edwardsiella hoshinae]|uniref:hypothetical protein n=1 Tax=Edwardsiella hoshinae TaxID=93378 RepID=UPI0012EA5C9A|nr:hypothetical protein [Edwardsiella hoshinae]
MRTKLLGLVIALGSITFANASSTLEITAPWAAKIDSIITRPINGMKIGDRDGQIVFLSEIGSNNALGPA